MKNQRTKNCPFCNGESSLIEIKDSHDELIVAFVKCEKCGASSDTFSTVKGAIEAWNMRNGCKDDEKYIGKWVAFRQEGMPMVLHGKVIDVRHELLTIKCKNGERRYKNADDVIGVYDSRQECCSVRN